MTIIKDWNTIAKNAGIKPEPAGEEINNETAKENKSEAATGNNAYNESELLESTNINLLEQQLNEAEKKVNDYLDKLRRTEAEKENILRRAERDVSNAHKYSIEKFAFELLPIVDNLERSLLHKPTDFEGAITTSNNGGAESVYLGVELTLKLFLETLQKFGITQINPMQQAFDPTYHTAMTTREDASAKPGTVLEVMQKGYLIKDRLLRPAMVVVAK